MYIDLVCPASMKKQLAELFEVSLRATVPDEPDVVPLIDACVAKSGVKFADYQCNNAMSIWAKIRGKQPPLFENPQSVGQAIVQNLPPSEMIESCSVAGPGFVNIVLSKKWIAQRLQQMLIDGIDSWAPRLPARVKNVMVDFSSPNIAKEMHVGHLRSTIIGDTIARMLEFCRAESLIRRNHIGDWGTEFGMLIAYLFENPDDVNKPAIGKLQEFYKKSKEKFDGDAEFKLKAQRSVIKLQSGEPKYLKAWQQICAVSRAEFNRVYERLGVRLEEMGESFFNPYIRPTLDKLYKLGLIEESGGALVIFVEGEHIPMIVMKSDGGFNYSSTDIASLWYADLKINRLTNYTFNYDQMLNEKGNTAVYLLYAHARICSIIRKSGKDVEEIKRNGNLVLDHVDERALGLHLVQFPEVFDESCSNLLPNVLCEYLYNLAEIFTKKFYSSCQVVGSPEETSRLLLCEATATVMRQCFYLLGIEPVYKL